MVTRYAFLLVNNFEVLFSKLLSKPYLFLGKINILSALNSGLCLLIKA